MPNRGPLMELDGATMLLDRGDGLVPLHGERELAFRLVQPPPRGRCALVGDSRHPKLTREIVSQSAHRPDPRHRARWVAEPARGHVREGRITHWVTPEGSATGGSSSHASRSAAAALNRSGPCAITGNAAPACFQM